MSGYMAACWHALARQSDIRLMIAVTANNASYGYTENFLAGLDWHGFAPRSDTFTAELEGKLDAFEPDVVVVSGWLVKGYRELVTRKRLAKITKIVVMDAQWHGTVRQRMGIRLLAPYLRHFDLIAVPGDRSRQYALKLGFPDRRIATGLLGCDFERFSTAHSARARNDWPRAFAYVGRYAPEKSLDMLIEAYQIYRTRVSDPWPLITCGKGPLAPLLRGDGIRDLGFQQPSALPDLLSRAGVFVFPSRYEPWGVALVEACAAGMPVIVTSACGAAVECVRDGFNGFVVPPDDRAALTESLVRAHHAYDDLPEMGARSLTFAAPYSAHEWAKRWSHILHRARDLEPRTH